MHFLQRLCYCRIRRAPGEQDNVQHARHEALRLGPRRRGPHAEEEAFVLARAEARFGTKLQASASAPTLDEIKLARAARHRTRFASRSAPPITTTAPRTPTASPIQDLARGLTRDYATRPTSSLIRATRAKSPPCSTGPAARTRPSRLSAADRACAAASSRIRNGHKGAVTIDLREMGKVKEVDKTSRAALIEGGTYGPALEAQLQAAWPDAPPFPAELRVFDARRLDRDARRRPFRDALHAHRRLRGIAAHGDAERHAGEPPPARLRRGPEPRPHDDRLGRHPRHHHAGLDAAAGSPDVPRRRCGALQGFLRRRARGARDLAGRALSVELPHPRSGRGLQHRRRGRLGRRHGAGVRVRRSRCRRRG